MDKWVGKVAVVTGASAGIGAEVSIRLAEAGIIVVGLARRMDRLKELETKLLKAKGKFHPVQCDMSKQDDILHAFEWIENHVGPVSVMVNNAGLLHVTGLGDGNSKLWKDILDVNFFGLVIATKEAIKSMRNADTSGCVIFMNSLVGHRNHLNLIVNESRYFPCYNVYAASKHAVTRYAGCLKEEIERHGLPIKVSNLSLGYVETEIMTVADYPGHAEFTKVLPPGMNVEDVADLVEFILSTAPQVQVPELIVSPVGW